MRRRKYPFLRIPVWGPWRPAIRSKRALAHVDPYLEGLVFGTSSRLHRQLRPRPNSSCSPPAPRRAVSPCSRLPRVPELAPGAERAGLPVGRERADAPPSGLGADELEVSKRMVRKQQMAWTERGAHLLLQVRTRVLNGELDDKFRRWYPKFRPEVPAALKAAACPPGSWWSRPPQPDQ